MPPGDINWVYRVFFIYLIIVATRQAVVLMISGHNAWTPVHLDISPDNTRILLEVVHRYLVTFFDTSEDQV